MILVRYTYRQQDFKIFFDNEFFSTFAGDPGEHNQRARFNLCVDICKFLANYWYLSQKNIQILLALTGNATDKDVVDLVMYSPAPPQEWNPKARVNLKLLKENETLDQEFNLEEVKLISEKEATDLKPIFNSKSYQMQRQQYLQEFIKKGQEVFLKHKSCLPPLQDRPLFVAAAKFVATWDAVRAKSLFGLDRINLTDNLTTLEDQQNSEIAFLREAYHQLKMECQKTLESVAIPNQLLLDTTPLKNYTQKLLNNLALTTFENQFKELMPNAKVYLEIISSDLKQKYLRYQRAASFITSLKENVAWAIYQAARAYYQHLLKNRENLISKAKTFNEKFSVVGICMDDQIGQLSPYENIQHFFADSSLPQIETHLRLLLKTCNKSLLGNADSLQKIYDALNVMQQNFSKDLQLNQRLFYFPWNLHNKTDFTWDNYVLIEEQKMKLAHYRLANQFALKVTGRKVEEIKAENVDYVKKHNLEVKDEKDYLWTYLSRYLQSKFSQALIVVKDQIKSLENQLAKIKQKIAKKRKALSLLNLQKTLNKLMLEEQEIFLKLPDISQRIVKLQHEICEKTDQPHINSIVLTELQNLQAKIVSAEQGHACNVKVLDQYMHLSNPQVVSLELMQADLLSFNERYAILQSTFQQTEQYLAKWSQNHEYQSKPRGLTFKANLAKTTKSGELLAYEATSRVPSYVNKLQQLINKLQQSHWKTHLGGGEQVVIAGKAKRLPKGIAELYDLTKQVMTMDSLPDEETAQQLWQKVALIAEHALQRGKSTRYHLLDCLFHLRDDATQEFYGWIKETYAELVRSQHKVLTLN